MKDDEDILTVARASLVRYLRHKGMRRTPERFAILEKIFLTDSHFYAESLRDVLEADGYHVSLSTVYSNVKLMIDAGLVRKHQFADQPAQYERVVPDRRESHYHLVCRDCGKVREVKDDETLGHLGRKRYPTFTAEYCAVYVYGLCSRCQRRQRREERERLKALPADKPPAGRRK